MKISLKWLNEFFPTLNGGVLVRSQELRERMPLSGLEIGWWKRAGEGIEDVIVAQIESFERHPNADKLNVTQVVTGRKSANGKDEKLQVVCGAPNVRAGMKVALAPIGAVLPGNFKIKQAQIRGVDSYGMLCSEKELGLSDESNGIMDLLSSAPVGTTLVKALGLQDEIWDVELTPDRGDCLSHWGVAREVGRLVGLRPSMPEHEVANPNSNDVPMMSVENQAPKACSFYGAQLFEALQNRESPEWLRRLLESLGIRSHNTVVDITNYVLMELGHPLHAFDADKISGSKIIVRFAKNGETITTLDGLKRTLSSQDLVIADLEKPLALAGVMGGLESGVTEKTTRMLLECAVFDKDVIRAMSQRHKVQSDASYRFERGIDMAARHVAAGRASMLIRQLTQARKRGAFVEIPGDKPERGLQPWALNFDLRAFKDAIGVEAVPEEIIKVFHSVFIESQAKSPNVLRVDVPTHRHDLVREIDLIEEAARLLGYDRIPSRYPPQLNYTQSVTRTLYQRLRQVRRRMVETGLTEMMPYSFISDVQAAWVKDAPLVELANPLSAEWKFMRPSLAFGLLDVIARHVALGQMSGAFFDSGSAFLKRAQDHERSTGTQESFHAGWALMGSQRGEHWSSDKGSTERKAQVDFYDAKGLAERMVESLPAVDPRWASTQYVPLYEFLDDSKKLEELVRQAPWIPYRLLHPGRSALLIWPGKPPGQIVGYAGELHPAYKSDLLNLATGLQLGVALGELRVIPDLLEAMQATQNTRNAAATAARGKIVPSRRLPVVERDMSLVVSADLRASELDRTLRKAAGPELLDLQCFDLYRMPDGKVSLSFRALLQGADTTLSDEQIQAVMRKMLQAASEKHGAQLRG
jgi:phenylalanyl-tRNA synthetase beta chain